MKPVHGLALPVFFSAEKRDFLNGGVRRRKTVWERDFLGTPSEGVGGGVF